MIKILYIGRHKEILETVVRLLNANEDWLGIGAETNEEALALFGTIDFTLVLLGCGINDECEQFLISSFKEKNPNIIIVQHYGGGSGLLKNEILLAIENQEVI